MAVARTWATELREHTDGMTGARVRQLTDYRGHSHHLYFTNSGWYDDGKKLLFGSDRENRTNLFSIELETGEIVQLTDLERLSPPLEANFQRCCVNPTRAEAYFRYGWQFMALDLNTLALRTLVEMPENHRCSILNCTADGKYVCVSVSEDPGNNLPSSATATEQRIAYWQSKPLSRIMRITVEGGGAEPVYEERAWINHVNTSPTQPHLLTFCHEGLWKSVDHRIWGFDLSTGKAWKIRERNFEGERIGHEYWHADGIYLGYHGSYPDGRKHFGKVRYDNTDNVEVAFPHETGHIHSNDFRLIVGHTRRDVRLWKWNGTDFDGPRMLASIRASGHIQRLHVHPRFDPEGSHVLYTNDESGYGNVYLAETPEFESLPEIKA